MAFVLPWAGPASLWGPRVSQELSPSTLSGPLPVATDNLQVLQNPGAWLGRGTSETGSLSHCPWLSLSLVDSWDLLREGFLEEGSAEFRSVFLPFSLNFSCLLPRPGGEEEPESWQRGLTKQQSLPWAGERAPGHKAALAGDWLDFYPYSLHPWLPLCSPQPEHLFEAVLGIQSLNPA